MRMANERLLSLSAFLIGGLMASCGDGGSRPSPTSPPITFGCDAMLQSVDVQAEGFLLTINCAEKRVQLELRIPAGTAMFSSAGEALDSSNVDATVRLTSDCPGRDDELQGGNAFTDPDFSAIVAEALDEPVQASSEVSVLVAARADISLLAGGEPVAGFDRPIQLQIEVCPDPASITDTIVAASVGGTPLSRAFEGAYEYIPNEPVVIETDHLSQWWAITHIYNTAGPTVIPTPSTTE